jgi:hypothetical protein
MSMDARRSDLPTGFPGEVPVPEGTVVTASGTGSGARGLWFYTIETSASVPGLAAWYKLVYGAANWQPVKSSIGPDVADLQFSKGDAQSLLRITVPRPGTARVEATVNLATPVTPAN